MILRRILAIHSFLLISIFILKKINNLDIMDDTRIHNDMHDFSMTIPQTLFIQNKKTEARRILHIASMIANRFYIKKGFLVLPQSVKGVRTSIYFPFLSVYKNPLFWQACLKKVENFSSDENEILQKIEAELPALPINFVQKQTIWKQHAPKGLKLIAAFFPNLCSGVRKIVIYPTHYGASASDYSKFTDNPHKTITLFWKDDSDDLADVFARLIHNQILLKFNLQYTWEERNAIKDFILYESLLKNTFPSFIPVLSTLRHSKYPQLRIKSNNYLKKLGFSIAPVFSIKEMNIFCNKKNMNLTKNEFLVMKAFIKKNHSVVSFDEIADIIWKDKVLEKYSLEAITKLIQRIRRKIKKCGIFPSIIETHRKVGYALVD